MNESFDYHHQVDDLDAPLNKSERVQWGEQGSGPETYQGLTSLVVDFLNSNEGNKFKGAAMALLALGLFAVPKEVRAQELTQKVPGVSPSTIAKLEKPDGGINYMGSFTPQQKNFIRARLLNAFAKDGDRGVDLRIGAQLGWSAESKSLDARARIPSRQGGRTLLGSLTELLSQARSGSVSARETKGSLVFSITAFGTKNFTISDEKEEGFTISDSKQIEFAGQSYSSSTNTQGKTNAAFERIVSKAIDAFAEKLLKVQEQGPETGFIKGQASGAPATTEAGSGYTSGTVLGGGSKEIPPAPTAPERSEVATSAHEQASLKGTIVDTRTISGKITISDSAFLESVGRKNDTATQLDLLIPVEFTNGEDVLGSRIVTIKCPPGSLEKENPEIEFSVKLLQSMPRGTTGVRLSSEGGKRLQTFGKKAKKN
jgi:hypothetical protein